MVTQVNLNKDLQNEFKPVDQATLKGRSVGVIKTPAYYHRQFENDLPKVSSANKVLRQAQRVALVALPFICLYKPLGKTVTVVMDSTRTITCLANLGKNASKGDLTEAGKALFKAAFAVSALACTILAHPLGSLITTGHDLIINTGNAYQGIKNRDAKQTLESIAHIANNSLYLGMFFTGSLELMVLSFSAQILFGLYHTADEYRKGNKIEAFGHLGMSAIRVNQLRPQIKALQFKRAMQKELKKIQVAQKNNLEASLHDELDIQPRNDLDSKDELSNEIKLSKDELKKIKEQNAMHSEAVRADNEKIINKIKTSSSDYDPELIDILIKYGNNPDGIPVLHYAIKVQDVKAVRLLLTHGANANSRSKNVQDYQYSLPLTALDYAAYYGNLDIINLLIDFGAKINPEFTFDKNGYIIEDGINRVCTPLFFAARNNHAKAIELLVKRGAKIDLSLGFEGADKWGIRGIQYYQPLRESICSNSLEAFKTLLDLGADYSKGLYEGPCYLSVACSNNAYRVLKEMLSRGCYVEGGWSGTSPLLLAAESDSLECCEILLEYGANVKAEHQNGIDVLVKLIHEFEKNSIEKRFRLIKEIINRGAKNINEIRGGRTLFHLAVEKNNKILLQFLLDNGADVNALDQWKRTPLDLAKRSYPDLVQWLIAHGAKD